MIRRDHGVGQGEVMGKLEEKEVHLAIAILHHAVSDHQTSHFIRVGMAANTSTLSRVRVNALLGQERATGGRQLDDPLMPIAKPPTVASVAKQFQVGTVDFDAKSIVEDSLGSEVLERDKYDLTVAVHGGVDLDGVLCGEERCRREPPCALYKTLQKTRLLTVVEHDMLPRHSGIGIHGSCCSCGWRTVNEKERSSPLRSPLLRLFRRSTGNGCW